MASPIAFIGSVTATGDVVTSGSPSVLAGGMPVARVGDAVAGAACNGAITSGAFTVFVDELPAAFLGSVVVGVNPATGVPVTTAVSLGYPTADVT